MSITAALAIAKATGLDEWIVNKLKRSDNGAAKLATKVIDFAKEATGFENPEVAREQLIKRNEQKEQFVLAITANEQALQQLAFKDREDARSMYKVHHDQADEIASNIMKYNPLYILLVIIALGAAYFFLKEKPELLMAATSILSMAVSRLFDERKEVTGFFYGSSMGSKQKDQNKDLSNA